MKLLCVPVNTSSEGSPILQELLFRRPKRLTGKVDLKRYGHAQLLLLESNWNLYILIKIYPNLFPVHTRIAKAYTLIIKTCVLFYPCFHTAFAMTKSPFFTFKKKNIPQSKMASFGFRRRQYLKKTGPHKVKVSEGYDQLKSNKIRLEALVLLSIW